MSNLKLIVGTTEAEFFEKELSNTLNEGMYLFKDTQNTAIVEKENGKIKVSLKTQNVREGSYNSLASGLILVNEGNEKGYALYYRRGGIDYAISGGGTGGGGTGGSGSGVLYTNLTADLNVGETSFEPTEIGVNYVTMDVFDSEGHELFIELRKYNRGFKVYSEVKVPNAQIRIIESRS